MRLSPRRFLSAHPFAAGAASALALVLGAACVAAASGHIHPFVTGTVDYEDTTSGPIIDGVQSGSGVGVEGVANTDAPAGAIAVDGLGTSTTDASIGVNGSVDGPSSTALIGNANDTSGQPSIGLEGFSENGEGVYAESESHDYPSLRAVDFEAAFDVRLADSPDGDGMSSQLESVTNGAGVLGDDTATTPSENAGVEGASANGLAGVYGTSDSGSGFGVDGVNSVTGPGVMGTSTGGGVGVMGVGPESVGVEGITDEPSASFSGAAAVSGLDESSDGGTGDIGVEGQSALGTGIEASSDDGTAIFAVSTEGVGADIRSSENTAVEARGATFGLEGTASGASGAGVAGNGSIGSIGQCNGSGTDEFEGADASGTVNFSVDCSGTVGAVIRSRDGMYAD
ncbi:MAG TPA: hypothetical protein VEJ20_09145, partial [Candidatus Eremiobacteraceae bacterium]|nr:hypothetical protein [Candidatus Eremiobacteraceae bacterium]